MRISEFQPPDVEHVDLDTGEISTDTTAVITPRKVTSFTSVYRHDKGRSNRFATINLQPSLTQQSDAAESDINVIVRRYVKTGQLPQVNQEPIYGDFSTEGFTYREMVEKINAANSAFEQIPADVRGRFGNDPQRWIEFVNNPDNLPELRKMGLAQPEAPPPVEPPPMKVVVVGDPPK